MVAPSCTGERPRASGVSGGQARQAFTRGSPAVEDAYLLPPPDQPGSEPSHGGVAVSRRRLLAPAATSTHHQRHWQRRVVPVATGIIHSLSRPALLGARPPSGVSLLRKRVGWTAPCPGRSQGGACRDKRYERGRPCSAVLLRGASVPPVVRWARPCAGEGSPRRTHASSTALETVRHAVSGAPTASPRQLPARGRALSPWSSWWVVVGRRPPGTLSSIRPASTLR